MVFVTHDQIEAMTMADRIVVLQSGAVQQYDTPESVYERPANQFVAGFIGSPAMNFFPVEWRGDGVVFSHGGAAVPLRAESGAPLRRAGKGGLGNRPGPFARAGGGAHRHPGADQLARPAGPDCADSFRPPRAAR